MFKNALVILGLLFFGYQLIHEHNLGMASQNWPSVDGVILSSYTSRTYVQRNALAERAARACKVRFTTRSSSSRRSPRYELNLSYSYRVDGRVYTGSRYSFDGRDHSAFSSTINALARDYPVGRAVRVYYDPARPRECTLVTGYQ